MLVYLAKRFKHSIQRVSLEARFYARTGVVLPPGCSVGGLENIELGAGFGISNDCKLLATPHSGNTSRLRIGKNVKLNHNVMLNADVGGSIHIQDNCIIGPNTVLRSSNHRIPAGQSPILGSGHDVGTIELGAGAWLGSNVVVLPNVRIGEGAVIGAGAVVTHDIPAWAIAVGVPAQVKSMRAT